MQKQSFMRADEVAQELDISKSHAYKVIHGLNEELQEKGYPAKSPGDGKRQLQLFQRL